MTEDVEEMWDRQAAAEERYSTPYLDLTREDVVAFAHGAPSRVAPGTVFPSGFCWVRRASGTCAWRALAGNRRSCSRWPARA
jgi:hypothetical protein